MKIRDINVKGEKLYMCLQNIYQRVVKKRFGQFVTQGEKSFIFNIVIIFKISKKTKVSMFVRNVYLKMKNMQTKEIKKEKKLV